GRPERAGAPRWARGPRRSWWRACSRLGLLGPHGPGVRDRLGVQVVLDLHDLIPGQAEDGHAPVGVRDALSGGAFVGPLGHGAVVHHPHPGEMEAEAAREQPLIGAEEGHDAPLPLPPSAEASAWELEHDLLAKALLQRLEPALHEIV